MGPICMPSLPDRCAGGSKQIVQLHSVHLVLPGDFVVMPSLVDMVDKGKAALISTKATIIDAATDQVSTLGCKEWALHEVTFVEASTPAHAPHRCPTAVQVYAENELTIFARGSGACGLEELVPAKKPYIQVYAGKLP